jgi:hypothetical protein
MCGVKRERQGEKERDRDFKAVAFTIWGAGYASLKSVRQAVWKRISQQARIPVHCQNCFPTLEFLLHAQGKFNSTFNVFQLTLKVE